MYNTGFCNDAKIRILSTLDNVRTNHLYLITQLKRLATRMSTLYGANQGPAANASSSSSLLLPPGGRTRRILWTISPRSRGHSCSRSEHLIHVQTWPQLRNSTVDCTAQQYCQYTSHNVVRIRHHQNMLLKLVTYFYNQISVSRD